MDNQRLLFWAIFGVLAWMTYQAWVQDYGTTPAPAPTAVVAPAEPLDTSLPALSDNVAAPDVPGELPLLEPRAVESTQAAAASIQVTTDTLDLQISTAGGTLTSAALVNYPVAKDRPDEKINLLSAEQDTLAVIQS
ncbi:MAG: membrane protein insertase YidC, partial [Halocynthiibacter sp.]